MGINRNRKTELQLQKLIDALKEQDSLSIKEIQQLLDCNRQSVYNYINRLKENGTILQEINIKHEKRYKMPDNNNESQYQPITKDVLRKNSIIQELQKGPIDKVTLKYRFGSSNKNKKEEERKWYAPIDIRDNKFDSVLNSLINDDKEIYCDPNNEMCYLSGNHIPILFKASLTTLLTLNQALLNLPSSHPYFEQLMSVHHKIASLAIGSDEAFNKENYFLYGKSFTEYRKIRNYMQLLEQCNFTKKIIKIEEKKSSRETSQVYELITGLVVYNMQKDIVYLIGKRKDSYRIVKMKNVVRIEETQRSHNLFQSAEFLKLFEEMFSISVDPLTYVEVEFTCDSSIERKIKFLHCQRKQSTLSFQQNGKLLYTDFLRGTSDFANYLRQFGNAVNVLQPASLKKQLDDSHNRTLNRYKELEHE